VAALTRIILTDLVECQITLGYCPGLSLGTGNQELGTVRTTAVLYYLGIDGGGTKTTCAVGDETRLLATATAGPSNIVRVGEAQTRESLTRVVRQACAASGIIPEQVARTCVGAAGAGRPELAEILRSILAEILPSPIDVVGDMETSLEAAFGDNAGVIANAGTGSFAYGRNKEGTTLRAGGWGFEIGDEGSAHWIGRGAVSALLRASDAQGDAVQSSTLAQSLFKAWGVGSLLDLARAANAIPAPDFAALFPAVASSNDDVARKVLTQAGRELAEVAAVVIRRLFGGNDGESVPVAMIGGVFRHAAQVRETFYNDLRRLVPYACVKSDLVNPVEGALRLARKGAGRV
jgi:glucosamine kinase